MTRTWPWLALAARIGLAGIWLVAGGLKAADVAAAGRAVVAYQIFPPDAALVVGAVLPFAEIAIGLLLLVGLATRVAGVLSALLFAVFIAGIASAWSRGLAIDCGCFGGGGALGAGESPAYLPELLRDAAFLLLALVVARWPARLLSLDEWWQRRV